MKRRFLLSLLLPGLLTLQACSKPAEGGGEASYRDVLVELSQSGSTTNGAGDAAYSFLETSSVAYATDKGDKGTAAMAEESRKSIAGTVKVNDKATQLWCYTPDISVPASLTKADAESAADISGMAFCTPAITLTQKTSCSGTIKPVTSAIVLDILDSKGIWSGKNITSVTVQSADDNVPLAGKMTLNLQEARIGEVTEASTSITFACSGIQVGTSGSPASLGAVVIPCHFTGTVTVTGDGFSGTVTLDQSLTLQAGFVKHITVDMNQARGALGFPRRLGIMGDSISSFSGIIPSSHRAYYPAGDVDDWKKTYWGQLATEYWNCEIDMNTSWSGSSVADGKEGSVRTPFVDHSRLDLFQNPDCILLFGGTNDAIASNGIGLGEFNFDTPLAQMNTTKRFRDAYIYVIRYLQEKHPEAQIICIIGTHVTGEYGASVETIAKHFNLPYVDFRGEANVAGKVTIYSGSHPDAAGHAYKARKIYEETLKLFQ